LGRRGSGEAGQRCREKSGDEQGTCLHGVTSSRIRFRAAGD
jgi:hypothetical protein